MRLLLEPTPRGETPEYPEAALCGILIRCRVSGITPSPRGNCHVQRTRGQDEIMNDAGPAKPVGTDEVEIREWEESLDSVLTDEGPEAAGNILERLRQRAELAGVPTA